MLNTTCLSANLIDSTRDRFLFLQNWKISSLSIVLALLSSSTLTPSSAVAQDLLGQEIEAYNRNDFRSALALGIDELNKSPTNLTARYYVAQALVKLDRRAEAIAQYTECERLSTDTQLNYYCRQALAALSSQAAEKPGGATAATHNWANAGAAPAPASRHDASFSHQDSTNLDFVDSRRDSTIQDGVNQIGLLRQEADKRISDIKQDMAEQLSSIPEFVRARAHVVRCDVENPEYQEASQQLQAESKVKIDQINAEFAKRAAEITADCKRRADAYGGVTSDMSNQQKP